MKKAILCILAVSMVIGSISFGRGRPSDVEIETKQMGPTTTLVLLPTQLIETMDRILKSNLSKDDKLETVRALFHQLGSTTEGKKSYCDTFGELNQSVNFNKQVMTLRCTYRLHNADSIIEELYSAEDFGGVQGLREALSQEVQMKLLF